MRLIVYAPTVRVGGGRTLLLDLLNAAGSGSTPWPRVVAIVDPSVTGCLPPSGGVEGISCGSRLAAERLLRRTAASDDVVLCFGNVPPLARVRGRVVAYVQSTYLLGLERGLAIPPLRRVRFALMRLWFRATARHADLFLVQTETVRRRLMDVYGLDADRVKVAPFATTPDPPARPAEPSWDFLYVSDGEEHKNHRRLLEAFRLLASDGSRPSLALTVPEHRYPALVAWIRETAAADQLLVTNLGEVPHDRISEIYGSARALIYPSLTETFGLPLVEAARLGLPIVASERDFVRDVVVPSETFDPESARSIARAAARFLETHERVAPIDTPGRFLVRLAELSGASTRGR
jgi:glycosyltransferase involved in cell wall biosynthesis